MERSRRVGVRSIYARNNEDGETVKPEEEEEKTSPVVGATPRTTSAPRTHRRSDGGSEVSSPAKRGTFNEDASTAKKRPAESTTSPPPKRRGRPPGSTNTQRAEEEAAASATYAEPPPLLQTRSPMRGGRRAAAAAAASDYLDQPVLEVHNDPIITDSVDDEMPADLVALTDDQLVPPSLDLCGPQDDDHYGVLGGGAGGGRNLLGGALARNRGRPQGTTRKSYPPKSRADGGRDLLQQQDQSMQQAEEELEEQDSIAEDQSRHNLYNQHRESHRYMFNPDILSDFYEPDMIMTEMGDKFLKARDGTLPSLLKREMILSLIVNDTERAEQNDWVNAHPPAIPPLTSNVGTYICFVDTKTVEEAKMLTTDGLSPWSSSHAVDSMGHAPLTPTRPKVRKWAVYMRGGEYCVSGEDWRMSLYVLVEYSALLPRAPRLRKKVYYMTRDRTLLGLAMLIYDYIEPGPVPSIMSHGNNRLFSRQRMECVRFTDEEGNRSLMSIPVSTDRPRISMSLLDTTELYDDDFEDIDNMDFVGGGSGRALAGWDPSMGPFIGDVIHSTSRAPDVFVRVAKGNWTSDKALLLKYLINDVASIPPFAINSTRPGQPPLISSTGCFATFLKGSSIVNQANMNSDALSPWTNSAMRPKTRKLAVEQNENGEYIVTRKDWRASNIVLMEMCTNLARCPRLRKRIYYVMRNNLTILGYVMYMYEYTTEGDPPEPVHNHLRYKSGTMGGPRGGNKYYNQSIGKMDDSMEDMNIDVMEIGEEVEVDELDQADGGNEEELEMVEDETIDVEDERDWIEYEGATGEETGMDVFEGPIRSTVMGDRYLVCRSRRLIGDKNQILKYCINDSNFVYDRAVVLLSKPFMPPLTSQMGIFVFFVAAEQIDLRQVNKDGLSPWSTSDNQEAGGKQMRTKVKKYPIERVPDEKDTGDIPKEFRLSYGKDWRNSEFVLVQLHSTLPRCLRLQKKVFYVLDTANQTVLGHVMIVYEYTEPGEPPRQAERVKRTRRPVEMDLEMMDDDGEIDKDAPFDFAASGTSRDQCVYVPLMDPAFLMDRNKQLHYCVNRTFMLERNGLLNHTVPLFPPLVGEKGDYVYFVSGSDMDPRNLTCDGMAPWSDSRLPQATRPKSRKLPVEKSRDGMLRYVGGTRWEQTAFFLVVYYAVLPRCPRLKKRIIYACNSSNEIIGNIMIIYSYSEDGPVPTQVPHGNATTVMQPFYRMPPSLRDEAKRLLMEKRPAGEVANVLNDRSPSVTSRAIYNISKSMRPPSMRRMMYKGYGTGKDEYDHPEWEQYDDEELKVPRFMQHPRPRDPNRPHMALPPNPVDGSLPPGPGVHKPPPRFSAAADSLLRRKGREGGAAAAMAGDDYDGYAYDEHGEPYIDVISDASIEVGHSEEIASTPMTGGGRRGGRGGMGGRGGPRGGAFPHDIPPLSRGGPGGSGGVNRAEMMEERRKQRIMDFIQSQAGLDGEDDTLDYLWGMVVERNERKVLDNIRRDFGVEIVTNDFLTEELVDGEGEPQQEQEQDEQVDVHDEETMVVDVGGGGEGVVEETVGGDGTS